MEDGNLTKIGKYTYGFQGITVRRFNSTEVLKIGSFCSIAENITIFLGGNHRTDWITTYPFGHIFKKRLGGQEIIGHPATNGGVTIGNDVWTGSGVTIMSGISIGDGAVISANAHVIKNVSPYAIVGGNPAKHIKFRFDEPTRMALLSLRWWDLDDETIKRIAPRLCTEPTEELIQSLLAEFRSDTLE